MAILLPVPAEGSRLAASGQPDAREHPSGLNPAPGPTYPSIAPGSDQLAPESDSATNWDRLLRARVGQLSANLSPAGLLLSYLDWLLHLGFLRASRRTS
jgi:hypothetical protein